ncbi:MAG TPA: hypothetical protein VML75_19675 [Kofleriaceae bacterium]|nr:hypothetical protein [Kofleriaceae bacterium]
MVAGSARVAVAEVPGGATAEPALVEQELLGGSHWRFETSRGAVHVWTPPAYDYAGAGIVVYVHGYRTNVDRAWTEHQLAAQFLASQQNALFIVPEAPDGLRKRVEWPSLGQLLREVRKRTGVKRPWGHVVAVGHSGAYRTLVRWLDYRHLDHIILLDGMYGNEDEFGAWLSRARGANKLILVGADTLRWTEPFVRRHRASQVFDLIPETLDDIAEDERRGRLLYMRSQYDHMGLVTNGKTIPVLLRLTRLSLLEAQVATVTAPGLPGE